MRAPALYALLFAGMLTLSGCSAASGITGIPFTGGANPASTPVTAPSKSSPAPTATTAPAPAASTAAPSTSDPAVAAIEAVIQKANQEQQTAFEKGDPTVMQDTATSSYYNELTQINSGMAGSGVSDIKLLKVEWGQVKQTGPTTAQATTFETWQTNYSDGSTDQSRQQNNYTLVLDQGAWKIQSDDNPNSNSGSSGGSPASSTGSTAPTAPSNPNPQAVITPASQTDSSRNWSGYAASSGKFTSVTGTWTVPQPQAAGLGPASGATWVGIGGVNSRDLIQAGTEETVGGSGAVSYDAWIEMLPGAARQIPLAVKAGDSITTSIDQQSSGKWLIKIVDNTTGEDYQTTVAYSSTLSSAEWIEEAPSVGRRIVPLDNFGAVQFTAGSAVENGKAVSIEQAGGQPISLTDGRGNVLAAPSVLSSDGTGFTVSQSQ